jgi:hypothetical protein
MLQSSYIAADEFAKNPPILHCIYYLHAIGLNNKIVASNDWENTKPSMKTYT